MAQTRLVTIELECCREWTAVLLDQLTGVSFPTKVTATLEEGQEAAIQKARKLAEIYLTGDVPQFEIAVAKR